jgi:hypothetical protein
MINVGQKVYLGDGLYMTHEGHQIKLSAEDGISVTNEVWMDPYVIQAFMKQLDLVQKPKEGESEQA